MGKKIMLPEQDSKQFFLLMYLDAKNLFHRIKDRKNDYIRTLSLKRNRKPLEEVFKTKYFAVNVENLQKYPLSIIQSLDEYYKLVDNLSWYLNNTEDMTQAITDKVDAYLVHIERVYVPMIDEIEGFNEQFLKTEEAQDPIDPFNEEFEAEIFEAPEVEGLPDIPAMPDPSES